MSTKKVKKMGKYERCVCCGRGGYNTILKEGCLAGGKLCVNCFEDKSREILPCQLNEGMCERLKNSKTKQEVTK